MKILSKISSLSTYFIMVSVFVVVGYFVIYDKVRNFDDHKESVKAQFITSQKEFVKNELNRVSIYLQEREENFYTTIKNRLKDRNIGNFKAIEYIYNESKESNVDNKKNTILDFISKQTSDSDNIYYFAISKSDILLDNGYFIDSEDIFSKIDLSKKEQFVVIKNKEKAIHLIYFEPFNIYIGIGTYILQEYYQFKKDLLSYLKKYRYDSKHSSYLWTMDLNYTMLAHGINSPSDGTNVVDFKTPDGMYLGKEAAKIGLAQNNGFLTYKYLNPKSILVEDKISYIVYIKEFEWIIGTGFYMGDIDKEIKIAQNKLQQNIQDDIFSSSLILFLIFSAGFLADIFISKKINHLEENQSTNLNLLAQYKKALDESAFIYKFDTSGKITYANEKFVELFKYKRENIIGLPYLTFLHPETEEYLTREINKTINQKKTWRGTINSISAEDNKIVALTTIIPILDKNGEIEEFIAASDDITELDEKREKLKDLVYTDPLTGLKNRAKLISDIEESEKPALVIFDIINFKHLNDFYGHKYGDYIIINLGNELFEYFYKKKCNIYRYGNDQYAILFQNYNEKDQIESYVKEIIKTIANKKFNIHPYVIDFEIIAGLAFENISSLLTNSDIALKAAKTREIPYLIYDKNIQDAQEYKNNLFWIGEIKKAIKDDRIVPFYQGIYNPQTKKIEKFETLIRLVTEGKDVISPYKFLEIAKRAKLYPILTKIMAQKSAKIFENLDYDFSINITVEDILNKSTRDYLLNIASNPKISHKMIFEIVESKGIENFEEVSIFLEKLHQFGCKIAIDDFGTGYSNFEYLLRLNIDFVKIDGSLIKTIDKDKNIRAVTEIIIEFAKRSNMKTIAEFVWTQEVLDETIKLGVDYCQGFLLCEPLSEKDFLKKFA